VTNARREVSGETPMPTALAAGEAECDLVPLAIRGRLADRARRRRSLALGAGLLLAGIAAAGWCEFDRAAAARRHAAALRTAAEAVSLLRAIDKLDTEIGSLVERIQATRAATAPVPAAGVVAALVESVPEGVTVEQISVDASYLRQTETRTRGTKAAAVTGPPKGTVRGTLQGFAPDDAAVAELVRRLEHAPALAAISLETARHRTVRGVPAREFRVSFEVRDDRRMMLERGGPPVLGSAGTPGQGDADGD